MQKKALITGITGQDGSYLGELLLKKGYAVYGLYRRSSVDNHLHRINHLKGRLELIPADLTDLYSLEKAIKEIKPDEIYNLAAQSDVGLSFTQPYYTYEVTWLGVERILYYMKKHVPKARFYQASTSELFGQVDSNFQSEKTKFNPVSPYAEAKFKAHELIKRHRKDGFFTCAGILFNHESPRRGLNFVTRKITDGLARYKLGLPQRETGKKYIELGNLDAKRDWGHAKDYVEAMWLMLQQDKPSDYIISTGVTHSVRDFVEIAAKELKIKISWKGEGINEVGYDGKGNKIVAVNPKFFRPAEVHYLRGDCTKAKKELNWKKKINFEQLVREMVMEDLRRLKNLKKIQK